MNLSTNAIVPENSMLKLTVTCDNDIVEPQPIEAYVKITSELKERIAKLSWELRRLDAEQIIIRNDDPVWYPYMLDDEDNDTLGPRMSLLRVRLVVTDWCFYWYGYLHNNGDYCETEQTTIASILKINRGAHEPIHGGVR